LEAYVKTIVFVILVALSLDVAIHAQTYNEVILYNFCSQQNCADGVSPVGGLVMDSHGNLFGTTAAGGDLQGQNGTVYELAATGAFSVVHTFEGPEGAAPSAGLYIDTLDNLYGTTGEGGLYNQGTIFRITPARVYLLLYSFGAYPGDGEGPEGPITRDKFGSIYGTTFKGGNSNSNCLTGTCGTVYKLTINRVESIVYAFTGGDDGGNPTSNVVFDNNENDLYGTTWVAGEFREGTIFKVDSFGVETTLYEFCPDINLNCTNGTNPGFIYRDGAGNIFTDTNYGGTDGGGTIFALVQGVTPQLLYSYTGPPFTGGAQPYGAFLPSLNKLIGATGMGGAFATLTDPGGGTIYRMARGGGPQTILHSFPSASTTDGANPNGSLISDKEGNLYGTAFNGGTHGLGVIFKMLIQ
jgi:uncharacterized repeat protein (TIGR03803 family)